jgi:hypothetical protein
MLCSNVLTLESTRGCIVDRSQRSLVNKYSLQGGLQDLPVQTVSQRQVQCPVQYIVPSYSVQCPLMENTQIKAPFLAALSSSRSLVVGRSVRHVCEKVTLRVL